MFGFSLLVRDEVVVIRDDVGVELSSILFLAVACPVEEDDEDSKRGNISTLTDFKPTVIVFFTLQVAQMIEGTPIPLSSYLIIFAVKHDCQSLDWNYWSTTHVYKTLQLLKTYTIYLALYLLSFGVANLIYFLESTFFSHRYLLLKVHTFPVQLTGGTSFYFGYVVEEYEIKTKTII